MNAASFIQGLNTGGWRSALIAIALLATIGQWGWRFDVTEDRRHSLTTATENMLQSIEAGEDEVLVRCYLEGNFPARYRRLSEEIKNKLRTFAKESGGKVRWDFIDVAASGDEKNHWRN